MAEFMTDNEHNVRMTMIPRTMTTTLKVRNMLIVILQMTMIATDSTDDNDGK